MNGDKRERAVGHGNNNDGEDVCGQENDMQQEEIQSKFLFITRLVTCTMTVILCIFCEETVVD